MNIFDFALQMEKQATDYYSDLARQMPGKGPRSIFANLASDHAERKRYIERVAGACPSSAGLNGQDLEEEANPWHGLSPQNIATADLDDEEAYRLALKLEEEEVRFFEELLSKTRARDTRRVLRQISEEEGRHVESIRNLYDFINAPNQYLAWAEFSNLEEFHQFGRDVD